LTWDETIAQLDGLLQADRERKQGSLALLRSVVQGLEGAAPPLDEPLEGGNEGRSLRGWTAPRDTFVPLPRRKTHGGNWGPAMRAKLRAQALAKR
jgi:hypothetical protein